MKSAEKLLLNLAELIKLKTIITMTFVFAVSYQFVNGKVSQDIYMQLVLMVVAFYFTKDKTSDKN